jgi:ankyrin repeat protein
MKKSFPNTRLFFFYGRLCLVLWISGCFLNSEGNSQDARKDSLEGEWIRYSGPSFEIKTVKPDREIQSRYDEYGKLLQTWSWDMKVTNNEGIGRWVKSNFKKIFPKPNSKHRNWAGQVDELAIWNRALSDEEVALLWNKGKPPKSDKILNSDVAKNLLGYWDFDGNLEDASGHSRHGKSATKARFSKSRSGTTSLMLNGKNDYVVLGGKASDYEPKNGVTTVSIWFQADRLDTTWQTLIAKGQMNNWRVHRHWQHSHLSSAGITVLQNPTNINDGKFHHLVAVMISGKGSYLYIDNQKNSALTRKQLAANHLLPVVGADLTIDSMTFDGAYVLLNDRLTPIRNNNSNKELSSFRKVTHPQESLLIAARAGNFEAVKKALSDGAVVDGLSENSYTALAYAAAAGHADITQFLHRQGAKINLATRFKKTPLALIAGTKHVEIAKWLIENGANVKTRVQHGASCLHEAIHWEQPQMLELLIQEGCDVNAKANNGASPLLWAAAHLDESKPERTPVLIRCAKILLGQGAERTTKNQNGQTAAEIAESKGFDKFAEMIR